MIKYLGSKRRLVPVLGDLASAAGAATALDLFTGTTRVAQEFKRRGVETTATDIARYSEIFARCYIETDASEVNKDDLKEALTRLSGLPGEAGYFTETFCVESRFFQPFNGERIDAIRNAIGADYRDSPLYPLLLTSLIEAADRVDSTTGVQMAYVKAWAPRSSNPLELRVPELFVGCGAAVRGDARDLVGTLGDFDLAYLDPPYNQHRYFTNYHIWETLVKWDKPEVYGVACKRVDCRDYHSPFNSRREIRPALEQVVASLRVSHLLVSFSNEGYISREEMETLLRRHGEVRVIAVDSKRYVGAQIGIYNPQGKKVGRVGHLRNTEYLYLVSRDGLALPRAGMR